MSDAPDTVPMDLSEWQITTVPMRANEGLVGSLENAIKDTRVHLASMERILAQMKAIQPHIDALTRGVGSVVPQRVFDYSQMTEAVHEIREEM